MMDWNGFLLRLQQIDARSFWIEIAVLVACVAAAWGVSRWFGRDQPRDSVWFGERTFDGLLFPLLALVLTDLARRGVLSFQPVLVLRIAVSVFVALVAIRLVARVLRAVAQSDVVLCGDQLCANVDLRGARSGDRKQYRAVRPRP